MIPVNIDSLVIGFMASPSVISLRPRTDMGDFGDIDRSLPIWIGPMEATSIAAALDTDKPARPLTHTMAQNLVRAVGGTITRVVIDRVEGTTFYATIHLRCPNGMYTRIDARPSDAIAMAITANAPLFVEDEVMESAATPSSFTPGAEKRIEMEEFHKFVEGLNPEDFVANNSAE